MSVRILIANFFWELGTITPPILYYNFFDNIFVVYPNIVEEEGKRRREFIKEQMCCPFIISPTILYRLKNLLDKAL